MSLQRYSGIFPLEIREEFDQVIASPQFHVGHCYNLVGVCAESKGIETE
jgi:hypothetical protein